MLMARYATFEKIAHPLRREQGLLIDLNCKIIELIGTALNEAIAGREPSQASHIPTGD
jgi:hypothetical protein